MTTNDIESWVLDYACKFHLHEVIAALHKRYGTQLSTLCTEDACVGSAALHRIVHCREIDDFDTAIVVVEHLYRSLTDVCPFRVYCRLAYGLKMKALLEGLRDKKFPSRTLHLKLNEYFPRCGLSKIEVPSSSEKDVSRLQTRVSNFRKFFLSLMTNENQRQAYMRDDYDAEFGTEYLQLLEKHVDKFIKYVNKSLPVTVLEKMMTVGVEVICRNDPPVSVAMDILMECLFNKTSLKSCDLLDLLTLLHPISTQDTFKPRLHVTFCSDDSSNDSHLSVGDHRTGLQAVRETTVIDVSTPLATSQQVQSSGESVSIISRKKPKLSERGAASSVILTEKEANLNQIFVISSSSDSNPSTQGSQVKAQGHGSSKTAVSNVTDEACDAQDSDICMWEDDSFVDDSTENYSSLSDIDKEVDDNNSSCIIPSSHLDETQDPGESGDVSTSDQLLYPSLQTHQKDKHCKLCVVKLYRNTKLDRRFRGSLMDMYS